MLKTMLFCFFQFMAPSQDEYINWENAIKKGISLTRRSNGEYFSSTLIRVSISQYKYSSLKTKKEEFVLA